MNLRIKYSPLFYTYFVTLSKPFCRWKSFINSFWYLFSILGEILFFPILCIFFLYLFNNYYWWFVEEILLFIFMFIIFFIFYEIWYIYNNSFSILFEKNPKLKIEDQLTNKFWYAQILIRFLLWGGLFIVLYNITASWAVYLGIDIIFMLTFFILHNKYRHYIFNVYTFFLLRLTKFVPFIIFLNTSGISDINVYFMSILYYLLYLMSIVHYQYSDKFRKCDKQTLSYNYLLVIFWMLFSSVLLRNYIYIYPMVILVPKLIFFIKKNHKYFPKEYSRK